LTAAPSADRCVNGTLLYQFWIDGGNGVVGDANDTLLQDFTTVPRFEDAPAATTNYCVVAKCSTASSPPCSGATTCQSITVDCPGDANAYDNDAWWARVGWSNKTTLTVPASNQVMDVAKGASINALRAGGVPASTYATTCVANNSTALSYSEPANPPQGDAFYYLLRGQDTLCNENQKYTTYAPRETPTAVDRRDDPTFGVISCPQ
jgi:hypothetical protein